MRMQTNRGRKEKQQRVSKQPYLPTHDPATHTYSVVVVLPPELVHKLPEVQLPEGAVAENVIVAVPNVIVGVPVPTTEICGFVVFTAGGAPAVVAPP